MSFSKYIIVLSHLPIFITALYALKVFKQLNTELKAFTYFLFISALFQLISLVLWFYQKNNLPVLHALVALGSVSLIYFYATVLKGYVNKLVLQVTNLLLFAGTVLNSLFVQGIYTFNSYAITLQSIVIIILSLSTYMLLLNKIVKEKRKDSLKSINLINSGLFIYNSSTLIIFFFGDVITGSFSVTFNRYAWVLHSLFSIVMYSCFFSGLWKRSAI